jgi:hypothetical protein
MSSARSDSSGERTSLSGLSGLHVVLEKIDPGIKCDLLETKNLQKYIEVTLSAAGIKVLTQDQMLKTPGMPYLYINLTTARNSNACAYHIQVELRQGAVLERDPNVAVTSSTWTSWATGIVGADEVNLIRNYVEDSVSQFIKAYIAANAPVQKR